MLCCRLKIFYLILVCCYLDNAAAQSGIAPLPLNLLNADSLNEVIEKNENEENYKILSALYGGMYMYYCESHDRELAIKYAMKAEQYALKAGDSARFYFTEVKLGEFSTDAHAYQAANSYYQNALTHYRNRKHFEMLFHVYGGLSRIASMQGDIENRDRYDSLAVEANAKGKDTLAMVILNDIKIRNLIDSNRLNEGILLAKKNLGLIDKAQTFGSGNAVRQIRRRIAFNFLGECYNKLGDYKSAISYLTKTVSTNEDIDFNDLNISRYHLLINSFISSGQKDSAIKYCDMLATKIYKALENADPEKLNEISTKYESVKKQKQIEQLKLENHLQQLTVSSQRKLNIAFIVIFAFLFITVYFMIRNFQHKRALQLNSEKQKAELGRQQAIQTERNRISSELHDDLGSGLSTIRLMSEMMKQGLGKGDIELQLDKISDSSKELVQKMNEIVWALNMNNDNLQSLLSYIRQYAAKTLDAVKIDCSITMPENVPEITLSGSERRNIFLIVKECINNILKHSRATKAGLEVSLTETLCINISDNGIGFSCMQNAVHHFGIDNLNQRAKELNGRIEWVQNNGTHVKIQIPIKELSHKSVTS
jgi:signal transduction histidine kinase